MPKQPKREQWVNEYADAATRQRLRTREGMLNWVYHIWRELDGTAMAQAIMRDQPATDAEREWFDHWKEQTGKLHTRLRFLLDVNHYISQQKEAENKAVPPQHVDG